MLFQQSTRLAQVNCPLGPDVLLLNSMGGGEELGRLFDYQLQLTSSDANIDLNQLLGKPMSVGLQLAGRVAQPVESVHGVMGGVDTGLQGGITALASIITLTPGTLNVFRGKHTAHRVTPVEGDRPRMIAVFSYFDRPGVRFTAEEQRGFYGRAA